jgi:hypothetical protein
MSFTNRFDAQVVSVRDFDYPIPVHSVFHPCLKTAAKRRLQKVFPRYALALQQAFKNRAANSVWGILIEDRGQPMCVVQNLACNIGNTSYRRFLRIDVSARYP